MIKFGPAGNDISFYEQGYKSTVEAAKWLEEIGLCAYEYSFGRGILLSDDTAIAIGERMKEHGISVSVHAPYYINFATPTDEMAEKSYDYVLRSAHKVKIMGGNRVVVHPASLGKSDRVTAVELTKKRLTTLAERLKEAGLSDVFICLETMGKQAQIGTYEEVVDFCTISPSFIPTFDFGHINALTGGSLKTEEDFEKIFNHCIDILGYEKTKICHIHFSKIEFGAKGEIRHLTFEDEIYGPDFLPLAKVIKKLGLTPTIICESKEIMAKDALDMKNIFYNLD